jgi:hypothetical protein
MTVSNPEFLEPFKSGKKTTDLENWLLALHLRKIREVEQVQNF